MHDTAVTNELPALLLPKARVFVASALLLSITCLASPAAAHELLRSESTQRAHANDVARDLGFMTWPALAGLGVVAVIVGAAGSRRPRSRLRGAACEPIAATAPMPSTMASLPFAAPDGHDVAQRGGHAQPSPVNVAAEARIHLAPHHIDLAMNALCRAVNGAMGSRAVAWLMLLDLCRAHGRESEVEELARRFRERFNGVQPAWNRDPPKPSEPGLEAFPHLVQEITLAWGTHECRRLIDRLLYDGRNGTWSGFPLNAYNDLLALRRVCDEFLRTIEADFVEEATLRDAFAAARAGLSSASRISARSGEDSSDSGALTRELEAQLADDLRLDAQSRSPLEIEHPALAGMLVHEWGHKALAARLCEILSTIVDTGHPLSPEAFADLAMLRLVADDLAGGTDGRNRDHRDSAAMGSPATRA